MSGVLFEIEVLEFGSGFGEIVFGFVAEEFAGVADVEAFEAVVADAVENGETEALVINTSDEKLIQVAWGYPETPVSSRTAVGDFRAGLVGADANGDDGDVFLAGEEASERFAKAFRDAVEVAGIDGFRRFDLDVRGIAGDGVDRGGVNDFLAAGGEGGGHEIVGAGDIGGLEVGPVRGRAAVGGEVEDGVDSGEVAAERIGVGELAFDGLAEGGEIVGEGDTVE